MSELTLDRSTYFPDPFAEWYRERAFQFAFAFSLLAHGLLIALVPGLRTVSIESPTVITVELAPAVPYTPSKTVRAVKELPSVAKLEPPATPEPEFTPPVERATERPEPVRPEQSHVVRRVEPAPEKFVSRPELAQPEPPRVLSDPLPAPRSDIAHLEPRNEPRPMQKEEPWLDPRSDIRLEPSPLPRIEARPVPRVEPVLEKRPEPKLEPRPVARVDPRPFEPSVEPKAEVRPEARVEPHRVVAQPALEAPAPRTEPPPPDAPPRMAVVVTPAPTPVPLQSANNPHPKLEPAVAPPAGAPVVAAPPPMPTQAAAFKALPDAAALAREESLLVSYRQDIKRMVDEQKRYPKRARDHGWQGTTKVRIHLAADGSVMDVVVAEKSEHLDLDEAALRMVKNLKPFPPLPDALRGKERTIIVPIQFRLDNS